MSIANFRKNRAAIKQSVENSTNKEHYKDDRFWNCETDKVGNGFAIIRLLPPADGETNFFVEMRNHGWQNKNKKWFVEACPKTIGKPCPICEHVTPLWNYRDDPEKISTARQRKALTRYVSNILVISDPKHPENEGKVFLWKYGASIFKKFKSAMNPEFVDEKAFDPYDPDYGKNFKVKIQQVDGYRNYDKCDWETSHTTAIAKTDDEMELILEKCYPLLPLIDESKFLSYKEIKRKFEEFVYDNISDVREERAEEGVEEFKRKIEKAPEPVRKAPVVEEDEDETALYRSLLDD